MRKLFLITLIMFFSEFVSADFNSLYTKARTYIANNSLTMAQVSRIELLQAKKALNLTKYEYRELGSIWESLRGRILKDMQEEKDSARISSFWADVRAAVVAKYPNVDYEREDRTIKIYLDGK